MHGMPTSLHNPVCVAFSFLISDSELSCNFMRYGLIDCDVVEDVKICHVLPVHWTWQESRKITDKDTPHEEAPDAEEELPWLKHNILF